MSGPELHDWKDSLEEVERRAKDDPLHTVFVPFSQRLPDCLFLRRLSCDADSRTSSIGTRRILLDLAEFYPLGWDVMPGIGEIEHAPELRIRVRFRNLEEW